MKDRIYYSLVSLAWVIYATLTFLTPPNPENAKYGLTPLSVFLLQVTFVIPYLFTWLIGLYGVLHLKTYMQSIKGSGDGKGISQITKGLIILFVSLILVTLLGIPRSYFRGNTMVVETSTIINNYIYVFSMLLSFAYFASGTLGLLKNIHTKKLGRKKLILPLIAVGIFSTLYIVLTFTNQNRQVSIGSAQASYYLPDILILTTIILPTIVSWVLGVVAIVRLLEYKSVVPGILYRKALKNFVIGILFVIISSAIIHTLLSLGTTRLLGFGLTVLIIIVYLFVVIQALGYLYIARGAKKLTMIETT